jgi:integrase
MTAQRNGGDGRLRLAGAGGVSARTRRRRLSGVSGLYGFLHARGDLMVSPVPRGLPTRRERQRPGQGVPLVRVPRTSPRILEPGEVDALTAALRTHRDRAMVAAMVLGGLRRCEVLGLRLGDLRFGERRVFIAEACGLGRGSRGTWGLHLGERAGGQGQRPSLPEISCTISGQKHSTYPGRWSAYCRGRAGLANTGIQALCDARACPGRFRHDHMSSSRLDA